MIVYQLAGMRKGGYHLFALMWLEKSLFLTQGISKHKIQLESHYTKSIYYAMQSGFVFEADKGKYFPEGNSKMTQLYELRNIGHGRWLEIVQKYSPGYLTTTDPSGPLCLVWFSRALTITLKE